MSCQRCKSKRVASVSGKCSDMCYVSLNGNEKDGYVPDDMGIGGDDYITFNYCLDCGQLNGKFPLTLTDLEKDFSDKEDE